MNIVIPDNLCTDLHTAKAGQIVAIKNRYHGLIPRLVTHVTPTRVIIQNGGGEGTRREFFKKSGHGVGETHQLYPSMLYALTPERYVEAVQAVVKGQLIDAIEKATLSSRTFEQVEQAANVLGVLSCFFTPPKIF